MKRLITIAVVLFVATPFLFGGGADERAAQPISVRGDTWSSGPELESIRATVDRFNERNPGIQVSVEGQVSGEKLLASFAAGDPPDFYYLFTPQLPQHVREGMAHPLDAFISGPDGIAIEGFIDAAILRYQEQIYGLPSGIYPQLLYFNKDMFDAAGIAYPDESWTWDDLATAAAELVREDETGRIVQYGFQADEHNRVWYSHFIGHNGRLFDDETRPREVLFNDATGVAAATFLKDLVKTLGASPPPAGGHGGTAVLGFRDAFPQGRVAMIMDGSWQVPSFNQVSGFRFGATLVPRGSTEVRGWHALSIWAMSAPGRNKDATWEYLKFNSDLDAALRFSDFGGNNAFCLPMLWAAYDDPRWQPSDLVRTFQGAASFVGQEAVFEDAGKWYWNIMRPGLQEMIILDQDPQSSMDAMARKTREEILQEWYR